MHGAAGSRQCLVLTTIPGTAPPTRTCRMKGLLVLCGVPGPSPPGGPVSRRVPWFALPGGRLSSGLSHWGTLPWVDLPRGVTPVSVATPRLKTESARGPRALLWPSRLLPPCRPAIRPDARSCGLKAPTRFSAREGGGSRQGGCSVGGGGGAGRAVLKRGGGRAVLKRGGGGGAVLKRGGGRAVLKRGGGRAVLKRGGGGGLCLNGGGGGLCLNEGEGGWEGVWDPKFCVPKMARPDLPNGNFVSHDGPFGLGGGGGGWGF